jgi:hypothetical protein
MSQLPNIGYVKELEEQLAACQRELIAIGLRKTGHYAANTVMCELMRRLEAMYAQGKAEGGEPVAWMYDYTEDGLDLRDVSAIRFLESWVHKKRAIETPLYAHPAKALEVDDAMVSRMASVILTQCGETKKSVGKLAYKTICDTQRAALTAALEANNG